MDILITVIALTFGVFLGWTVAIHISAGALAKFIEHSGLSDQQLKNISAELGVDIPISESESEFDQYVEVRVEEDQGILYAYRDDTDEFLAQERDPRQLVQLLIQALPPRTWVNIPEGKGHEHFEDIKENG